MWCAAVIISFDPRTRREPFTTPVCRETAFVMVLLQEPPVVPSLAASRSLPSLAARTPSRSRSALSTPAGTLLSEQLLVHLHRAQQPQQHAKNPQALPLHASGALGRRSLSNTQLPTIVGGLMRAQRAKFLDHNIARDDSKERCSIRPSPTH